jgi:hypothetical protein
MCLPGAYGCQPVAFFYDLLIIINVNSSVRIPTDQAITREGRPSSPDELEQKKFQQTIYSLT